jgi:hypothetical protein
MVDILGEKNIVSDPLHTLTYNDIFQPDQSVFTNTASHSGDSLPTPTEQKNNTVVEGTLRVVDGYIGGAQGWIIKAGTLKSEGIGLATQKGDPTWAFWAGNDDPALAEFRVSHTGDLVATSATISGSITATTGRIANWYINTNTLSSGPVESTSNVLIDSANSLVRLGPTSGNYITLDGANLRIRSSNYSAGVAGFTIEPNLLEAENILARGSLRGATFTYDVVSAVGGQLMVANADILASDMTALDSSTMTIRGDVTFATNNIVIIRAVTESGIQEEWMRVYDGANQLVDSYSESNQNTTVTISAGLTTKMVGQSFTSNGYTLSSCKFYLRKNNSPTGSVYAKLYSHSGTFGSTGVPLTLLATSDAVDISTLSTSFALVTFTFSGAEKYAMVNGTNYFIVFDASAAGDATNSVSVGVDTTSPTHGGNRANYTSSWASVSTSDACFYVYGDRPALSANSYYVIRDLASSFAADNNPAWKAGTPVTVQGTSDGVSAYSGGWLRLLGEGTNSPHYSVFSRTGTSYNSYSERVRLGNLNGIGGQTSNVFGIFAGNFSAGKYLMYDDSSGDLIVNDSLIVNNSIFGDGSDGDVTISSNTTLTSDMFYNNLTIQTGFTLNPNGYRIFVKNTLTFEGTGKIISNGGNGAVGTNGGGLGTAAGGAAGTAANTAGSLPASQPGNAGGTGSSTAPGAGGTANVAKGVGVAGVAGGTGGTGNGGGGAAGGAAGTITGTVFNKLNSFISAYNFFDVNPSFTQFNGSSTSGGGGGGMGNPGPNITGGGGGGSGASGGIIWVAARKIITVNGNTYIQAIGGNGATGGSGTGPSNYGSGGGGAGGSGGVVVLTYSRKTGTGAIDVAGGSGGAAGTSGSTAGTAGLTGKTYTFQV